MKVTEKLNVHKPVSKANQADVVHKARRAKLKRYLCEIGNKLNLSQLSFYK